jgi:hypothetical integral membrane protein (TIGR02206 family)
MSLFFTYETDLPANVGFSWYGAGHWVWLMAIALCCIATGWLSPKLSPNGQTRLLRGLSLASSGLILAMELLFALQGNLFPWGLPLHLCAMAPFLTALHAFFRKDWLSQVVYFLCLPGALAALLFPGWSNYPLFSFLGIEGFLSHGLILCYGAAALSCKTVRPQLRRLWKVWVFLAVIVPPVYWFDERFDCNYWFVRWPVAGSPLEPLSQLGTVGYLVGYGILALMIMLILGLPWSLVTHFQHKIN